MNNVGNLSNVSSSATQVIGDASRAALLKELLQNNTSLFSVCRMDPFLIRLHVVQFRLVRKDSGS